MRAATRILILSSILCWMASATQVISFAEQGFGSGHPPGQYVVINQAKIWVESEGQGTPMILIAGGPGLAHDYFHPYFSELSGKYRLIYFDAFGRGRSDRAASSDQYTFSRDVDDLEGVRQALGLARVVLFGHSYGGLVAQAYALKHPQVVEKVILANSLFSGKSWQAANDNANREIREKLPLVWARIQTLRAQGLRSSSLAHQEVYQLPPGFYWHRKPEHPLNLMISNSEVYYAIVGEDADFVIGGEIAGLDFMPKLKDLKVPLLVLAGRYDHIAPISDALEVERRAPQAAVRIFEQSGHFTFIEENEKTLKTLKEFLF